MENTLKLVGRNSNEIFLLRYPSSLLDFCGFDLSYFAKTAIDACSEAQKTGKADPDVFAQLRRDIQNAHCLIAHNIRTTYEKVALDCWIDYLCRRDSIGTGTLWNRYITCRTPFDKMVFSRLCEFRYNRAINEWLNIVRVQDYAKSKIDFVFTKDVKNAREAASRRNYFDLMFSVTAQEMGCRVENLGEIKVFSVGRTPSSPFMFSTISKDIVRHVLADFDYTDDYSDIGDYSEISDQIAMDAFSKMKAGLPAELSSYNIVRGKMENYTDKIYMPCSLKAVVDLEIDAIIESGGILCACKRCGRLYLKNEEYNEDYCRTYLTNGKTCLELYREENPLPVISPELEEKCRTVTDEIYARVGTSMSTKEYEYWHSYMSAMRDKVMSGEITAGEFDAFLDYSLSVDISRSRPIVEVPKHEDRPSRERVVKPFVPERISRSELSPTPEPKKPEPEEEPPKDGFFTSPTVFRRKNEGQQISHIIRGGEPRSAENGGRTGFQPFSDAEDFAGKKAAEDRARLERRLEEELRRKLNAAEDLPDEAPEDAPRGEFVPFSSEERGKSAGKSRFIADDNTRSENYLGEERGKSAGKSRFAADDNTRSENYFGEERGKSAGKSRFGADDNARSENYLGEERGKTAGKSRFAADDNARSENYLGEERGKSAGKSRFSTDDNTRNENYLGEERGKSAGKSRFAADDNTRSENYLGEERGKTAGKSRFAGGDNTRSENYFGEERGKSRFGTDDNTRSENYLGEERGKTAGKSRFAADDNTRSENYLGEERGKSRFVADDNTRSENYLGEERGKSAGKSRFAADDNARSENYLGGEITEKTAPKPKVIKKNAAAISAYGKISGAPVTTAPPDMDLFPPKTAAPEKTESEPVSHSHITQQNEQTRHSRDYPEDEPFKDIGSIFDVLEQSESDMGAKPRRTPSRAEEPPEREIPPREEEPPREVTKENAPSGIWTEDRHLYGSDTQSELDMLKEKKHAKSNKTRRLYDVIMREPDDNPNFRRKN